MGLAKMKEVGVVEANGERPSAGFSITLKLEIQNQPGAFARVTHRIAELDASLAEVALLSSDFKFNLREVTVLCRSEAHAAKIVEAVSVIELVRLVEWRDDTYELHRNGKINVNSKIPITSRAELSRAYTPGVARVCKTLEQNPAAAYDLSIKGNSVAVISDGSAVLGLGNIGPLGALPVMEGKCMIFKEFAGINAFPLCLATQDTAEIIKTIEHIAPVFGGINLEDIAAPRCFEIEAALQERLDIPVFHDDQHGTAVVVVAGLLNSLKIIGKKIGDLRVVVNGFGAGGVACARLLMAAGVKNIIPCDTAGIVYRGRKDRMNDIKAELAEITNPDNLRGDLATAMRGADMFLGVSAPKTVTREMVASMARDAIVFALANPVPEIMPDEIRGVARIIATGRSDYANQVNNALCFPGIFRGALDIRAHKITTEMKLAAARAIAECVGIDELNEEHIIPSLFNAEVPKVVAQAVRELR